MPAVKGKAPFNFGASIQAHANDETEYNLDFSKPPPGITSGVAQFASASLGTYKNGNYKGQKFFRAVGIIKSPKEVAYIAKSWQGDAKTGKVVSAPPVMVKTRGLQTSIMIKLCDTEYNGQVTTADEHVKAMLNEIRKLAGEEATAGLETEADLEALLKSMSDDKSNPIYFKFSTDSKDPSFLQPVPFVNERWFGTKDITEEDIAAAEGLADAQDNSGGEETAPDPTPAAEVQPSANGTTPHQEGEDLDALAKLADKEDKDAVTRLSDIAGSLGISDKDMEEAKNWGEVVDMIRAIESGGDAAEPEAAEASGPAVGDVVLYQLLGSNGKPMVNPRTKKPLEPVECEIAELNDKKGTVTLKNKAKPTLVYKDVPLDKLTAKA